MSLFHRPRARSDMLLGYSFTTSQYGLAVDNVAEFELPAPKCNYHKRDFKGEDLWFGLRVSREARY